MEGIMVRKVCLGGVWWRGIGVYVNRDLDAKLNALKEWVEEREEVVRTIIGGTLTRGRVERGEDIWRGRDGRN